MRPERPDPWAWRARLLDHLAVAPRRETVALAAARGRLLATPLLAPDPLPAHPVAAMDGFAVRHDDLGPEPLEVAAELPARPGVPAPLPPGTAARIMTGAPIPAGADTVVPVEDSDARPTGPAPRQVRLRETPRGRHVRTAGEEVARGQVLAEAGDRVGAGLLGLAATLGITTLPVWARPRLTVVTTGDELSGEEVPGAVRESNGAMLRAVLEAEGAAVRTLRSGDDPDQLHRVLDGAARGADLVVTTGGISQGAVDVVKAALGPRGTGTSRFVHLALRPGGPQGAGTLPGPSGTTVPVVHLPGTPVGALVGAQLFVRPLLPGADARPRRVDLTGTLPEIRPGTTTALPGRLRLGADGREAVEILEGSRLAPYGRAEMVVLLEGQERGSALAIRL